MPRYLDYHFKYQDLAKSADNDNLLIVKNPDSAHLYEQATKKKNLNGKNKSNQSKWNF